MDNEKEVSSKKRERMLGCAGLIGVILIAALVVFLQGNPDDRWTGVIDENLVGSWERTGIGSSSVIVTFNSDGTGYREGFSGDWTFDWSVNGDEVIKRYSARLPRAYSYSISNDILRLNERGREHDALTLTPGGYRYRRIPLHE